MPEIIPLGWFHTIVGIAALLSGAATLIRYKEIGVHTRTGQFYLLATLITAATALAIFQHGFFTPAHGLAVLTLIALAVGTVAAVFKPIGGWSRYLQALAFSGTLLFHCIPAITDALLRLPVGDPILDSIESPVLKMAYLGLLVLFLIGIAFQFRWIARNNKETSDVAATVATG
ncbi:MAG: hypothetical protein AAF465_02795 [Pseudomonadota bacterium]